MKSERDYMRMAIEASRNCRSEDTRSHPRVGVVVVKDGEVLAISFRGEEGAGDHAEFTALEKKLSDETLAGATVYTTLEPCTTRNHPKVPCAERLIERKVARVVIGMLDPNPVITGKGQRRLRDANISTDLFHADLMAEVEELNREFTRAQTKAINTFPEPVVIGDVLAKKVRLLQVSPRIKESIRAVIEHPGYPAWMSIGGTLVRNPVWDEAPNPTTVSNLGKYNPGGPNPPPIMHLDMLLIRRNDERGHGQLDTYLSSDWGTYLLHFRLRLPEDKRRERIQTNVKKLARRWSMPPESIQVRPLPDKYAISIKPHPRYLDPIIYVFEFCSVVLATGSKWPVDLNEQISLDEPRPRRKWQDLGTMRRDKAAWSVNGDIIRALHEMFSYDLGPLPVLKD